MKNVICTSDRKKVMENYGFPNISYSMLQIIKRNEGKASIQGNKWTTKHTEGNFVTKARKTERPPLLTQKNTDLHLYPKRKKN